jgi:uncharacterized membrane protein YdjX (TVP38/TMEM64 family)
MSNTKEQKKQAGLQSKGLQPHVSQPQAQKKQPEPKGKQALSLGSLAFPILLVLLVAVGFLLRGVLAPLLSKKEALRGWVLGFGAYGWLVFIALQILQVVIFIIPGEVMQISGGFIFGFWGGLALTVIGIGIGSAINVLLGKVLGPQFLMAILSREQYEKLQRYANDARTFAGLILLFLIPGIPKDVLCYFAGAGGREFLPFLVASMLARMPGIIGTTLAGSAVYKDKFGLVVVLAVVTAIAMILGIVFRNKIEAAIKRLIHRKTA